MTKLEKDLNKRIIWLAVFKGLCSAMEFPEIAELEKETTKVVDNLLKLYPLEESEVVEPIRDAVKAVNNLPF